MSLLMSKLKVAATSLGICGLFLAGFAALAQPQAAAANSMQSEEQEILALEQAWGEALVNRDPAVMDRIVAYEMVGTDPAGHLWDKPAYLERVKAGSFLIESFELSDMKVHVYGDAAVAIGLSIVNKHSKSGYVRFGSRFTDTYVPKRLLAMRRVAIAGSSASGRSSGIPAQGIEKGRSGIGGPAAGGWVI